MLLKLIDDVTDHLNVQQKPGLLLTIDYCQAFDRISKDFIRSKILDLDMIL